MHGSKRFSTSCRCIFVLLTEMQLLFLKATLQSGGRLTAAQAIEAYKEFGSQIPSAQLQALWKQALGG